MNRKLKFDKPISRALKIAEETNGKNLVNSYITHVHNVSMVTDRCYVFEVVLPLK